MCDLKAHDHSVQVATDLRSGMTLMDHGNIIDSGATLSLTPSNPPQQFMRIRSRRPVPGGTFGVKPFSKDGKPVPISEMCTLRVLYTNDTGAHLIHFRSSSSAVTITNSTGKATMQV